MAAEAKKMFRKSITLGTVQFGLPYGIMNEQGQVSPDDARDIIYAAVSGGVSYIDSAAAYGSSEAIVGSSIEKINAAGVNVISKLEPFSNAILASLDEKTLRDQVRFSVLRSLDRMRVESIQCLMLHRAHHLYNEILVSELMRLKQAGMFKELGVSVQSVDELILAIEDLSITVIQMPTNILDYRWETVSHLISDRKKIKPLTVHGRSALFQGLLTAFDADKWHRLGFENSSKIVNWMLKIEKQTKIPFVELCLRYVASKPWIDSIVIGVQTEGQLKQNMLQLSKPALQESTMDQIDSTRPYIGEHNLNPSNWKTNV